MISKRRALGDITNNAGNQEHRDTKKPAARSVLKPAVNSVFQQHEHTERTLFVPPAPVTSHTVAAPTASDRLYMQRDVDDIDSRDQGNPLLVTTYVNDMYDHFQALEKDFRVSPMYMSGQELINEKMRAILVDWLVPHIVSSTHPVASSHLFICCQFTGRSTFKV
jgi:hypothetical protein